MIGKTPFHEHRATAFMQKEQKTPFLPGTNTYPVANKDRSHGDSAAAATTTFVAVQLLHICLFNCCNCSKFYLFPIDFYVRKKAARFFFGCHLGKNVNIAI